ncbi:MAG TPA: hypothetical protein VHV83_15095 [Armatimonadota bacterium]|nr:hypothetical protein [Armatimonadota bacterium]
MMKWNIRHMMVQCVIVSLITSLLGVWSSRVLANATIVIDGTMTLNEVQPYIFGQNTEAGDGYQIFGTSHSYSSVTGGGLWNPSTASPVPQALTFSTDVGMKMLRFPGGCLAHNYNWKNAVGPVANRPNFTFGIDEFIAYCRTVGAEPVITVSDYTGTAQDAADLVEYLNAPADANHPWAQNRALWGHTQPFNVRYFELGNETYHGNHNMVPAVTYTPQQYVTWFNQYVLSMRAIDPTIQLGAVLDNSLVENSAWDATVIPGVGSQADFFVAHLYAVGCGFTPTTDQVPRLMQACMASGDQFEKRIADYKQQILNCTGRNIPIAATEFNASFVQDNPAPYRFSLGAGLFSADLIRIMLKEESNILMANYWQFINGYWGLVKTTTTPAKKMPAYYLFRLWAQHFGTQLVPVDVSTPAIDFKEPICSTKAAYGTAYEPNAAKEWSGNLIPTTLTTGSGTGYTTEVSNGVLHAHMTSFTGEAYSGICSLPAPPTGCTGYEISFEAYSTGTGLGDAHLGLGMQDSRGWSATQSAIAVEGAESASAWTIFTARYTTLSDCPGATVLWRLRAGSTAITGDLYIRNLQVTYFGNLATGTVPSLNGTGYTTEKLADGTLHAHLSGFTGEAYPLIYTLPQPRPGCGYDISFEAYTTGTALTNTHFGLGMQDSRGWSATHSAIGVEGAESASTWTTFSGRFTPLSDCPGATVLWRLRAGTTPVTGDVYVRNVQIHYYYNLMSAATLQLNSGTGYSVTRLSDGTLHVTLTNYTGDSYPGICTLPAPPVGCGYQVSFDACSSGTFGTGTFGIGMQDGRGWTATQSAIGIEGIEDVTSWTHFTKNFATLPDCPGGTVLWRLLAGSSTANGTLDVKNLQVSYYTKEHFPAYSALTATASLSTDGSKLYLIVFNKDTNNAITTDVYFPNMGQRTVKRWTVTGPSLDATNATTELVTETESGVDTQLTTDAQFTYSFPPRSMTAFELTPLQP